MYSRNVQNLIDKFSKFPTVGPRTAARFVFYLLGTPKQDVQGLIKAIARLRNKMRFCSWCYKPFEVRGKKQKCKICSDPSRDKTLLCVVEKEMDLEAMEKTNYKGLYFILGKQKQEREQRLEKFIRRLNRENIKEVVLALSFTSSGERTLLWLKSQLKNHGVAENIKISQLGCGLPQGGELEYADEETLTSALNSRG